MNKINRIQSAILSLDPGSYQKMMESYLIRKFSLSFCEKTSLGSHVGSNKTTKGTPDFHARRDDGKFICIEYGTVTTNSYEKVKADIYACLDDEKTGVAVEDIAEIICCHVSTVL